MKNPMWIINSALLLFMSILFFMMILLRSSLPKRIPLTPENIQSFYKPTPKINPGSIYEKDLFKTYVKPPVPEEPVIQKNIAPPPPPQPKTFTPQQPQTPELLPPLEIELKGIIFNSNARYSRAIIMNKKSNKEELYKIGEKVEDAHLIYISKHKVIFIRSNGQQEVLFTSALAAQNDPIYSPNQTITAIEKLDETNYIINVKQFKKEVSNLAQFLDLLDITTAFNNGVVVGCHVGNLPAKSLGNLLGLQSGDVITSINNIPTINTKDRVKIYKSLEKIVTFETGHNPSVPVKIMRNNKELEYFYALQKNEKRRASDEKHMSLPAGIPVPHEKIHEVTEANMKQTQTNNKIADTFKKNDKKSMVEYGGRNNLLQR